VINGMVGLGVGPGVGHHVGEGVGCSLVLHRSLRHTISVVSSDSHSAFALIAVNCPNGEVPSFPP